MEDANDLNFIFSTSFGEINNPLFDDWGVHLVCLQGSGSFLYKDKRLSVARNDAMVLSHPKLAKEIEQSDDLQVVFVAAPFQFLYNQLPANHYGVGGCVSLFDNPIFHLSDEDAKRLLDDFYRIKQRMDEKEHPFYKEMMGSLSLTMIYDLFAFHAKQGAMVSSTDRTAYIVKELIRLLSTGSVKTHREVSYYAGQLNVTPKYLSDTIKRNTGRSVLYMIDQYTVPMVSEFLKNSALSITQIADIMNFSSVGYFSRYVVKHLGMPPSQYRAALLPTK